jgi:hypothetical protein
MGTPLVVMSHLLRQDSAQVFLAQWNHKIPNTHGVCFPLNVRSMRSPLVLARACAAPEVQSLELLVHLCREDGVTVTDQETVRMIARNRFAKLLQGPGRRWMCGDVAMHDAPCADLHQEEHIESSEPSGHYDQEIAGDDGLGVIANKRPPVLRRAPPVASSLRFWRPIGAHGTSRYPALPTALLPHALVPKSDSLVPFAR